MGGGFFASCGFAPRVGLHYMEERLMLQLWRPSLWGATITLSYLLIAMLGILFWMKEEFFASLFCVLGVYAVNLIDDYRNEIRGDIL